MNVCLGSAIHSLRSHIKSVENLRPKLYVHWTPKPIKYNKYYFYCGFHAWTKRTRNILLLLCCVWLMRHIKMYIKFFLCLHSSDKVDIYVSLICWQIFFLVFAHISFSFSTTVQNLNRDNEIGTKGSLCIVLSGCVWRVSGYFDNAHATEMVEKKQQQQLFSINKNGN